METFLPFLISIFLLLISFLLIFVAIKLDTIIKVIINLQNERSTEIKEITALMAKSVEVHQISLKSIEKSNQIGFDKIVKTLNEVTSIE